MRILIVEDEERLRELVVRSLERAGLVADAVGTVDEGQAALATTAYDAIILDLGLPDEDGLSLLRDLRARKNMTPTLILTARDGIDDRVEGLNAGADDYLLKPFAVPELIARVKALLRRPSGALGVVLELGNIRFDTINRSITIDTRPLALTPRELTLLENLIRRAGQVVPKDHLEERIYGFDDEINSNSLEVLLHRLRKKLDGSGFSGCIYTVRGVGYMLAEAQA